MTDSSSAANSAALDRATLESWLAEEGAPPYRADQVLRWLFAVGISSYDEMTDVSAGLRARLADRWPLARPALEMRVVSELDDTRRYLWRLSDGATVESVGLPTPDRLTVCFSTQAGCAMGCTFCATGDGGLVRDLAPGEMVDQVRLVGEDYGRRVTNAVAMGQGEPFANYDATLAALRLLNDSRALTIGARHLTVSTCGIIAGIQAFSAEPEQFTLAVSLHSAVQATRDQLMPGVRTQTLDRLRQALMEYSATTGRRPSLEFALIEGVNDSEAEVRALVTFCDGLLAHVNLIPVNPTGATHVERPGHDIVRRFLSQLQAAGVPASVRTERGTDIDAACGQLTQRHAAGA